MNEALVYVIAIAVVLGLAFALRYTAKQYTNSKVALVMLSVEKKLSTWAKEQAGTGAKAEEAAAYVANRLYPILPIWVKLFITQEQLVDKIEELYSEMLDYFDDGLNNDSIKLK